MRWFVLSVAIGDMEVKTLPSSSRRSCEQLEPSAQANWVRVRLSFVMWPYL